MTLLISYTSRGESAALCENPPEIRQDPAGKEEGTHGKKDRPDCRRRDAGRLFPLQDTPAQQKGCRHCRRKKAEEKEIKETVRAAPGRHGGEKLYISRAHKPQAEEGIKKRGHGKEPDQKRRSRKESAGQQHHKHKKIRDFSKENIGEGCRRQKEHEKKICWNV